LLKRHPWQLAPAQQPDGSDSQQQFQRMLETALQNKHHRLEWWYTQRDGSLLPVEVSLTAIALDETTTLFQSVCRDIRPQKQTEEQLQASKQILYKVIDNIPQAIFWKDRQSVYLGCNHLFAQAAGLDHPSDIVGLTDHDLPWEPEQAELYRSNDQRIMSTQVAEYHLLEAQRQANGDFICCDTNKIPLYDSKNQVIGILGTFENITERKRIEDELYESKQLLELVLNTMPQCAFWKSKEFVYLGCNYRFAELIGIGDPAKIVGKTDYNLPFPEEEVEWNLEVDRQVMQEDQPIFNMIISHQYDGNESRGWAEVSKVPLHDRDGNVIGILGTFQDVTDRIEAQNALQKSEVELRKKAKELEHSMQELHRT